MYYSSYTMTLLASFLVASIFSPRVAAAKIRGQKKSLGNERKLKKHFNSGNKQSKSSEGKKSLYYTDILSTEIGTYPDYEGDLAVSGTISMRFNDNGIFLLKMNAGGLDLNCVNCGVHIHTGTTCEDASLVGGHYYDSSYPDPWTTEGGAVYNTSLTGYTDSAFLLDSGFNLEENNGHAVVVYARDSSIRVGCGILYPVLENTMGLLHASIDVYPEYTGNISVLGDVEVVFNYDGTFGFHFAATGLEPDCTDCGVHIHTGTTCNNASLVGDHYWNDSIVLPDPWDLEQGAHYASDTLGVTSSSFYLYSGFEYEANVGHSVVVFAQDGTRIGCGLLTDWQGKKSGKTVRKGPKPAGNEGDRKDGLYSNWFNR